MICSMKEKKQTKSLTKNSIFYLLYNFLNIAFPLITGIYVAHVLLPYSIGLIESARNLTQYFVILAFLGIPTYGLREIAKSRNDRQTLNKTYSELMILNGISTLFFAIVYFSLIVSVPFYRGKILIYSITGISIVLNFFNNSWLYEGLEEFKYISLRNLLFKIISFILLLILVRSQDDYLWYAIITILGTAGNYFFNVLKSKKFVSFSFKNINLKKHLVPILFLVFVNLAIEIYSLVDVTMLNFMCDEETVAFYSYGMKIFKILLQLINTFTIVIVPRISFYYKEKNFASFNQLITKTLKIIFCITCPCVLGIWFTSGFLIPAVYGSKYIHSASVLNILSIILLIAPVGYLLGSRVLLITGNEKKMIYPVLAGAVVNLASNFVLINLYRELGAAIASLLGEIVVMAIYVSLGKRYFKLFRCNESVIRYFIAILLMATFLICSRLLPTNALIITIVQITGSILIYSIVLYILKEDIVLEVSDKIKKRVLSILRIKNEKN